MRVGVFFTEFFFTVFSGCYPPLCGKVFLLSILMGHYLVLLGFYGLDCARRAHENHLGLTVGGGGGGFRPGNAPAEKKNPKIPHWSTARTNRSGAFFAGTSRRLFIVLI